MVFWQSPRTRRQARPDVRLPTARAAGVAELEIVVDVHERYAYTFADQQVRAVSRGLPCGDYAISVAGELVAAVERKSLSDLVSSLTSGRPRFALGELATLPRAAVVVEDRYSQIFALHRNPYQAPPRSAPGRVQTGTTLPTGAGCAPRSSTPGNTLTTPDLQCAPQPGEASRWRIDELVTPLAHRS